MRTEKSSFKARDVSNHSVAGDSSGLDLSPKVRTETVQRSGRCLIQRSEQRTCSSPPINEAIAADWPFNQYSNDRRGRVRTAGVRSGTKSLRLSAKAPCSVTCSGESVGTISSGGVPLSESLNVNDTVSPSAT